VGEHGVVRAAASMEEHVRHLSAALAEGTATTNEAFVRAFVRPQGLATAAAGLFADCITRLTDAVRQPVRPDPQWVPAARPVALAMAFAARTIAEDRPLWVLAIRPFVTASVHSAASAYRVRQRWRDVQPLKRVRRATWRAWYESSQQLRRQVRRAAKPVKRAARQAGGAARRMVRRQL
jgi:hypothetical protein